MGSNGRHEWIRPLIRDRRMRGRGLPLLGVAVRIDCERFIRIHDVGRLYSRSNGSRRVIILPREMSVGVQEPRFSASRDHRIGTILSSRPTEY